MGELQFAAHALLAEVALDEPRVLDRGTDLVCNRRDELAVAGRERVFTSPISQVDHADGRRHATR